MRFIPILIIIALVATNCKETDTQRGERELRARDFMKASVDTVTLSDGHTYFYYESKSKMAFTHAEGFCIKHKKDGNNTSNNN